MHLREGSVPLAGDHLQESALIPVESVRVPGAPLRETGIDISQVPVRRGARAASCKLMADSYSKREELCQENFR
jgi:hypothetical protein